MRNSKILIRLNESEKGTIEQAATSESLAPATWARNQLLRAAREELLNIPVVEYASRSRPRLLSLFCGCDGLDEGFRQAGFVTSLAYDIDDDCINTFRLNHKTSKAHVMDVNKITLKILDRHFGSTFDPVGVIGGPPCQSFSHSNVHQTNDDPRHKLPETYAGLLTRLNKRHPISFFVFENVPGLLGKKHIARYEKFRDMFKRAGFSVHEAVLDAKDYNVPQERKRVFIVGFNRVLHPNVKWHMSKKIDHHVTVREAIERLPDPVYNDRGLDPNTFPVHPNHWCLVPRSKKFTMGMLEEGQAWGRSFRTLSWDKPSWAVAYGHREVHVHPNGHRRLSIYEAMKLQTFPDSYRLVGNMTAQIRLVSDAVPVELARNIAETIKQALKL